MADARELPLGRVQAGDRHLNLHETRDNVLEETFGDYAVWMNTIPKHVASRTLTEVEWNAALLQGDLVDAVREPREQSGGDILKIGTGGSLSRTLLKHQLVDEYLF